MASLSSGQAFTVGAFLALLKRPEPSVAETALGFRRLHRLVESMPLTTDEFSFAQNWLCSAEQLWEAGDRHTARYQVGQVAKKLML
jgi:hypothetical protein